MDTPAVAVVGAGFIGPVHIEALKRAGVPVIGVLGADREESERARQAAGLETAFENYDALLADPRVASVHLAIPNRLHHAYARQALIAGKHVLCEKPLAMTSAESAELVALARDTGLEAGVCYNIRFYPLNLEARALVRSGELGPIHSVVGSYVQDWLLRDTDYNWRVLSTEGGALRAVADIGTHWMDLVTAITGLDVVEVFADLQTVHPIRKRPRGEVETFSGRSGTGRDLEPVEIDTEDAGSVLFRFAGGARGALWVSQATAGRKNCLRYEMSGSRGALAWNSESPNELWKGHRGRANEMLLRDPALLSEPARNFAQFPGGHNEGFPDTFKQLFRAFYGAVRDGRPAGEPAYPTFAEGHREVVLCEAILESHRTQSWVQV